MNDERDDGHDQEKVYRSAGDVERCPSDQPANPNTKNNIRKIESAINRIVMALNWTVCTARAVLWHAPDRFPAFVNSHLLNQPRCAFNNFSGSFGNFHFSAALVPLRISPMLGSLRFAFLFF
jgi:hypothetical protein